MGIIRKLKALFEKKQVVLSPITILNDSDVLKGKNVVITGGSSGIGKAIAVSCVNKGANVIIVGRREETLKKVSLEIGEKCSYYVLDVSGDIPEDIFCKISNNPITDLVNNAGVYVNYNSLNYTKEDFDNVFNTNCRAPFLLSQLFIKYLKGKNQKGTIVFTSSNRALMGDDGPYGMSKTAINSFIEGLARENIKSGIRVNGVAPGMTASRINGIDINGDLFNSSVRVGRTILPQEIAEIVCFLLSDISKCVTGAIIPCDEGDRLR